MSKTKPIKWTESYCLQEAQAMLDLLNNDATIYTKKYLCHRRGYSHDYFTTKLTAKNNTSTNISKEIKNILGLIDEIIEVRLCNIGLPGHPDGSAQKTMFLLRNWYGYDKGDTTNVTVNLPPPAISPKVLIPNNESNE